MLLLHDMLASLAQHINAVADHLQLPQGPAIDRASIAKRWQIVDVGKDCTEYMLLRTLPLIVWLLSEGVSAFMHGGANTSASVHTPHVGFYLCACHMWPLRLLVLCAEPFMEVVSLLCSHPAWQPQFCEVQQSQGQREVEIRAALHVVVTVVIKCAKLLPEHVSKAIETCFLSSEVGPCSLAFIGTSVCLVAILSRCLPATVAMSHLCLCCVIVSYVIVHPFCM